jgi:hypothetical protein
VDPGVTTPVVINGTNLRGIVNASQFSASGSGVTFSGTPVVNVLGTQVTGLNVTVAAGSAAGPRDVLVSNSDGSGTSSGNGVGAGLLTVTGGCSPPVILVQPLAHENECPGANVLLNVGATGGPFTYQWRKNGAAIAGATNIYLSVSLAGSGGGGGGGGEGLYDVVVTNSCGPTTSEAVLVSVDTSGITSQPTSQIACLGGSAEFDVGTSGTVAYQWQKDGNDVPGATGPQLVIDPVAGSSVGTYTCAVTTNCDTYYTQGASLTIGAGLSINAQPQSRSVCEGASASLTFDVTGAGSLQWRKDGQEISGATSATLQINSATESDSGDYECVATSDCGSSTSDVATLSVCSAVSIDPGGQPASTAACPGSNVSFTVAATGTALTYQWRKGGQPISGANSATLAIAPVASADAGTYDCVVGNCCQQVATAAASLTVCATDFNCSGTTNVQDIFDFLNSWFAGDPRADFNGVGGINVQDIFDFLNAWFQGC